MSAPSSPQDDAPPDEAAPGRRRDEATDDAPTQLVERPPQNRSAMLERPRAMLAWFGRRLFNHVRVDDATAARLRALPEQGVVVYVMRTRSLLDYLFFNHLFLKVGAPLARFANGVDLTFLRGFGKWVAGKWRKWFSRASEPGAVEQLDATVRREESALLFMKVRALTAERQSDPGFIERLVTLQREMQRPILLLPQLISWPRKPPSKRKSWFDIAFGEREASGRLRKLGHFIRSSRLASVQVGEPIDLKAVLADHADWSDTRIARKVRRVLLIHLAHESMAISGPGLKPSGMIQREIIERRRFRQVLAEEAKANGISPASALAGARRDLKEIAANINFEILLIVGRVLDFVFNRIFAGVEIDAEGMRRVKEAAKHSRRAPLVLVPSHKSHFDYLVISWVFLRNEFIPPHVAAGANLSFFPLGSLFRRVGAFFLRRSFAGQPLYKVSFKFYLWKLLREGYPVEFFMEGGRSRTGKLLPPKLGIMSFLTDGVRRGEYKDLQFVPINISYERVVETASYRRELTGGEKEAESVTGVVKASKVLRSRYGRVYVGFERPVRLSEYLEARDLPPLPEQDDAASRALTKRLGYHLMYRIQEATVVSPSSLVGAVLLSHFRRGLSGPRLREMIGFLVELLAARGARLSRSIEHTLAQHDNYLAAARTAREQARSRGEALRPLVDEALALLRRLYQRVDRGGEAIYTVPDKNRIELDYSRNTILGVLAPDCILATAVLAANGPLPRERLSVEVHKLSDWFKLEFVYPTDRDYQTNFITTLERQVGEGLLAVDAQDRVHAAAPLTLDFLRGMMLHVVEGYWIAADALRALKDQPMGRKEWVEHAREHGEREFLQGDVRRAESASTALLGNALTLFIEEGLVAGSTQGSGRKATTTYGLAEGRTLEDLAFRRDDLGVYLLRGHDDPLRRSTAAYETDNPAPIAASLPPPEAKPEDG
ncbi:MAG: 1-acyl-sn-glycerol-3-phosphate acyltransferase [Myxococcales bacterium]|nr:1-acyl-sn-glycerol-3-phosphate acyltransferase [Myxococcales bacterium]